MNFFCFLALLLMKFQHWKVYWKMCQDFGRLLTILVFFLKKQYSYCFLRSKNLHAYGYHILSCLRILKQTSAITPVSPEVFIFVAQNRNTFACLHTESYKPIRKIHPISLCQKAKQDGFTRLFWFHFLVLNTTKKSLKMEDS